MLAFLPKSRKFFSKIESSIICYNLNLKNNDWTAYYNFALSDYDKQFSIKNFKNRSFRFKHWFHSFYISK